MWLCVTARDRACRQCNVQSLPSPCRSTSGHPPLLKHCSLHPSRSAPTSTSLHHHRQCASLAATPSASASHRTSTAAASGHRHRGSWPAGRGGRHKTLLFLRLYNGMKLRSGACHSKSAGKRREIALCRCLTHLDELFMGGRIR